MLPGSPIVLYASLLVLYVFMVLTWHDMYLENFLSIFCVPPIIVMICAAFKLGKQREAKPVDPDAGHWVQTKTWTETELDLELVGTVLDQSSITNNWTQNELDLELAGTMLDQRFKGRRHRDKEEEDADFLENPYMADKQRVRNSTEYFVEAALTASQTIDQKCRTCSSSSRNCCGRHRGRFAEIDLLAAAANVPPRTYAPSTTGNAQDLKVHTSKSA